MIELDYPMYTANELFNAYNEYRNNFSEKQAETILYFVSAFTGLSADRIIELADNLRERMKPIQVAMEISARYDTTVYVPEDMNDEDARDKAEILATQNFEEADFGDAYDVEYEITYIEDDDKILYER